VATPAAGIAFRGLRRGIGTVAAATTLGMGGFFAAIEGAESTIGRATSRAPARIRLINDCRQPAGLVSLIVIGSSVLPEPAGQPGPCKIWSADAPPGRDLPFDAPKLVCHSE
jgi:hypothetical protein